MMSDQANSQSCPRAGGWFGGDECQTIWPSQMTWYWAKDRTTELIIGVGMLAPDKKFDWWFFINGTQYKAEEFDFAKACVPDCLAKTHQLPKD
jgi:hypothetical protein